MKILIVDDDSLVALSLKTILETKGLEICALGNSGEQAVALYKQHKPDILLMDIRMENMTGLEAAEKILSEDKAAKILFLTTFSDDEYILKALDIGAKGYILKQNFESIEAALLAVERGQSVFGGEIVSKLPELMQHKNGFSYEAEGISPKEWEITTLVAEGLSNKEIANRLYLSEGPVRTYISSVLEKLSLRDRTQLAVFYYQKCGR